MNHWILHVSKHQNSIICYEHNALNKLSNLLQKYKSYILFVDENVFKKHREAFAPFKPLQIIQNVEESKSINTINQLTEWCIDSKINKSSLIVAIGGGALSDLVGFFSSMYMRGVDLAIIPTTLLSMIDASIGGKNGVNVGNLKNYLGTIHQPNFIINDVHFLSSLPKEEWISGFAEIIKYGCIEDKKLFETLENHNLDYYQNDPKALMNLIEQCVIIKSKYVEKDTEDKGVRKKLNFGHTFGHVYEKIGELKHGFAISIGMNIAAKLSLKHGLLSQKEYIRIQNLLQKYQLPTECNIDIQNIEKHIFKDKKSNGDQIDFILLKKIGMAEIVPMNASQLKLT